MTGRAWKPTWIAAITLAVIAALAPRASAESTGIVVVTGKAAAHDRTLIESAIILAVRKASWSLSAQPFTAMEIEAITRCLRDDRPWHCLSPMMAPKGVDRILVADANPQAGAPGRLAITGDLVVAGDGAAAVSQQWCDSCDDDDLAFAAQQMTDTLLQDMAVRSEQTILVVQALPFGATVTLDGQSIGITTASGTIHQMTYAGPHKLVVQRNGYVFDERTINVSAGRANDVLVELRPEGVEVREGRALAPLAIAGVGVAGVMLGGVLIYVGQQDGPDDRRRYIRATALGVVAGVAGTVAVGIGIYLWRRPAKPSRLALGTTPGGVVVGWAGAF
jgi:YD repeat-containing protein